MVDFLLLIMSSPAFRKLLESDNFEGRPRRDPLTLPLDFLALASVVFL